MSPRRALPLVAFAGGALRRIPGVVVSALVLAVSPVTAQQVRASVGIGAVTVRYANTLDVSMVSITPTLTWVGERGYVGTSGVLGSASMQGLAVASAFTSADAPLAGELATTVGGSVANASATSQGQLTARVHWRAALGGVWAGAGVGRVGDGTTSSGTRVRELGGWAQWRELSLTVTHTPVEAAAGIRYADTQGSARWHGERFELDGVVGARGGTARVSGIDDPGHWASLTVTAHLTDRLAVVAGGGSYPLDLLQGFPAGRFATVGLRFSRTPSRQAWRAAEVAAPIGTTAEPSVALQATDDGRWLVRLRAEGATRLDLQGDPTGWTPVAMEPEGAGWFRVTLALASGVHEVVVRRDGGAWGVPIGLASRRDEFGSVTGLLVVP